jgi:hypothetical protein
MSSLDLRHWVFCSLGPVDPRSPVSIQEDHVQGQGLCLTRATITLTGTHRPATGSPVSLAYSDGVNYIARVPRRLRVLSSQVDPLEGITTISAGCLLTYHSNRKPPVESLKETEENSSVPEIDRRVAVLPMESSWVAAQILARLGLTAANGFPFQIKRVVDEWDMSSGYVEELGRIAHSEGYFAWINESEQVEFISKRANPVGAGPILTGPQILEMAPVNVGDLPGDAAFARYTSLKLREPDQVDAEGNPTPGTEDEEKVKRRNWEKEVVFGAPVQAIHTYADEAGQTQKEYITYNDYSITETSYDSKDRVIRRREGSSGLNGASITITEFVYGSGSGEEEDPSDVREERTTQYGPKGDLLATCGANGPHAETFRQQGTITTGWRVTTYDKDKASGITQTKTRNATQYVSTPFGSDAIAKLRDADEPLQNLLVAAGRLVGYGSQTRIRTEREFGLQKRPGQQERNASALAKDPSANSPSIESVAEIIFATGSPASQSAIELSPPYVSDDSVIKTGGAYRVIKSSANFEAQAFGRGENRLLLGNRNGQGLQLHPLDMPAKPFAPIYVRVNDCTACYRANGSTWTLAADGSRCTTDGLFWAAVDGTVANAWFPLPPGIANLPGAAAVTTNANPRPPNAMAIPGGFNPLAPNLSTLFAALPSGLAPVPRATVTPGRFVQPYNITIPVRGGVRVGAKVRLQRWLPKTIQVAGGVRVGAMGRVIHMIGTSSSAIIDTKPATLTQVGGFGSPAALILHFDGTTFVDSSTNAYTVTANGNAALSATQYKFGGKAAAFDGSDGFVTVTGANLAVGVGNWAAQAWIRLDAGNTNELAIIQFGTAFGDPGLYVYPSGGDNLIAWLDDGLQFEALSGPIPDATWVHVLASKEGSTVRVFVGGIKSSSDYTISGSTATSNITATTVQVGGAEAYTAIFAGYIDDVVIEPGRVVDANFTPPTAAYPNP